MKFSKLYNTEIINCKVFTYDVEMIPKMIPGVSFLNYENINTLPPK